MRYGSGQGLPVPSERGVEVRGIGADNGRDGQMEEPPSECQVRGRKEAGGLAQELSFVNACAVRYGVFPVAGRNRRPGNGTSGRGIYAVPWRIRSRTGEYGGPPYCGCIF